MKISALDENNKPVDWWFIYKVPQLGAGAGTDQTTGYQVRCTTTPRSTRIPISQNET